MSWLGDKLSGAASWTFKNFVFDTDNPISWGNAINVASIVAIPFTGGLSLVARGALGAGKAAIATRIGLNAGQQTIAHGFGSRMARGALTPFTAPRKMYAEAFEKAVAENAITGRAATTVLENVSYLPRAFSLKRTAASFGAAAAANTVIKTATGVNADDTAPVIDPETGRPPSFQRDAEENSGPLGRLNSLFNAPAGLADKAIDWLDGLDGQMNGGLINQTIARIIVGFATFAGVQQLSTLAGLGRAPMGGLLTMLAGGTAAFAAVGPDIEDVRMPTARDLGLG